jgi:parvulin-like peptidyl-prolyl isomerase
MKRTLSFVVLVALLALPACSSSGDLFSSGSVAATVNGHDISADDVTRGAHGFGESAIFRQQLSSQGVDLKPTGPVPTSFAAQWLQSLIQTEAIRQIAAKRGVEASDQEKEQAAQQFAGTDQNAQSFRQLPKWLQQQIIDTTALQAALAASIKPTNTDAKADQAYQQLVADCPSKRLIGHILVATPEAAQQAIDRVNGGESFAAVSTAVSTDTGSSAQGGLLMCEGSSQWSQIDATFRAAAEATPPGQLSPPVQTQFGYHVIEALDLTPENARPLVTAAVSAENPLSGIVGRFFKSAKLDVNPRFGTLKRSGTSFSINPPTPKKVRSLPEETPSTSVPASGSGTPTPTP